MAGGDFGENWSIGGRLDADGIRFEALPPSPLFSRPTEGAGGWAE